MDLLQSLRAQQIQVLAHPECKRQEVQKVREFPYGSENKLSESSGAQARGQGIEGDDPTGIQNISLLRPRAVQYIVEGVHYLEAAIVKLNCPAESHLVAYLKEISQIVLVEPDSN
ncbi:MAG: hypothetical protein DDT18_01435 [Actinobacteria bacterium]|nr:hypothetical protein [Actinomycetota bacterium]